MVEETDLESENSSMSWAGSLRDWSEYLGLRATLTVESKGAVGLGRRRRRKHRRDLGWCENRKVQERAAAGSWVAVVADLDKV